MAPSHGLHPSPFELYTFANGRSYYRWRISPVRPYNIFSLSQLPCIDSYNFSESANGDTPHTNKDRVSAGRGDEDILYFSEVNA